MIPNPQRTMDGGSEKYGSSRPSVKEVKFFVPAAHQDREDIVLCRQKEEKR